MHAANTFNSVIFTPVVPSMPTVNSATVASTHYTWADSEWYVVSMVREERWEGRLRGRCMDNYFVHIKLRIITNSNASK